MNPQYVLNELQHVQYMNNVSPPNPFYEVNIAAKEDMKLIVHTEGRLLIVNKAKDEEGARPETIAVFHHWLYWMKLEE